MILLDLGLPGVSGMDSIREFRTRIGDRIPIVMLTGTRDSEIEAATLEAGADDYITKPFKQDVLKARLERHLHRATKR